ncbi:MAG: peptide-methionine (R)-S-oxide reductase [Pseudomonadota bacterium]
MTIASTTRRNFLARTVAVSTGAAMLPTASRAMPGAEDTFAYEVTRTEDEWRAMLSRNEYRIMRDGGTEWQRSSPYWDSEEVGTYCCKGCGLPLYSSATKVVLPIGWVFFRHSITNAILTDLDPVNPYGNTEMTPASEDIDAIIEVHCRRCGSHLGHLVSIGGAPMHCINGAALDFVPETA